MAIAFAATIPGTPLGVGTLRAKMAEVAQDCGMDAEGIAAVRLAVTEAATNAVIHAYAKAEGELTVTATTHDGKLAIVIADTGPGLVDTPDNPGLGLGLSIIASVAERLKIISHARGTEIHMAFPCLDPA
jgi:stage II sporulation protein AB (anti-sigma F factor)